MMMMPQAFRIMLPPYGDTAISDAEGFLEPPPSRSGTGVKLIARL